MNGHIPYAEGSVVSKTIIGKGIGDSTLFSFDPGRDSLNILHPTTQLFRYSTEKRFERSGEPDMKWSRGK